MLIYWLALIIKYSGCYNSVCRVQSIRIRTVEAEAEADYLLRVAWELVPCRYTTTKHSRSLSPKTLYLNKLLTFYYVNRTFFILIKFLTHSYVM